MDDIRAVMDAVGSERAALLGFSEGTALSALFAASHPERTTGLILYDGFAVGTLVEGAPVDQAWAETASRVRETIDRWGGAGGGCRHGTLEDVSTDGRATPGPCTQAELSINRVARTASEPTSRL